MFHVLFLLMYITISFLFVCKFTNHSQRVGTQSQLINIVTDGCSQPKHVGLSKKKKNVHMGWQDMYLCMFVGQLDDSS